MAKVMVVDDEESVRLPIKRFLGKDGHEIILAENAGEALELVERHDPDVIVTDIVMPRMSGMELFGRVREISPDIQVIIITGEPTIETAARAVRGGAFDYISKPISSEDIRKVVSRAVEMKRLNDDKKRLEKENLRYREHLEEQVKERTRELLKTQATLRTAMDQSQAGVAIADADGTINYVNNVGLRIGGKSKDELAVPIGEYFSSWELRHFDGTALEEEEIPLLRAVKYGDVNSLEFIVHRPDRDIVVWTNAGPVLGKNGEMLGGIAVFLDITDRKRAEEALRESEERYRTYIENAPDGIFIIDSGARYLEVNEAACRMTGYSRNELLNMSIMELAPPDSPPEVFESFERLKKNGKAKTEIAIQRKNGSIIYASLDAVALSDGRYMAFCSDITERKEAEKRIKQEEEKRRNVVINTTHLIHTPLTIIKGNLELIRMGMKELTPELLDTLLGSANNLSALVEGELYDKIEKMTVPTYDGFHPVENGEGT